jgi:hypothetical protein
MKKLLVTTALCAVSTTALATETLKWRHVQHASEAHAIEVGDTKGHITNILRTVGIASFPDGSAGPVAAFGFSDTINGSGTIQGYFILTIADGSELRLKYTGTISAGKIHGTNTVIGGTGKFADAKDDGTFEGSVIRASGANVAMNYIDNVVTLNDQQSTAQAAKAMLEKTAAAIKAAKWRSTKSAGAKADQAAS